MAFAPCRLRAAKCICQQPLELNEWIPIPGLGGLVEPQPLVCNTSECLLTTFHGSVSVSSWQISFPRVSFRLKTLLALEVERDLDRPGVSSESTVVVLGRKGYRTCLPTHVASR